MSLPSGLHSSQDVSDIVAEQPEWGEDKYCSLQFHDGAFAGEEGTYYPAPNPTAYGIRLLS